MFPDAEQALAHVDRAIAQAQERAVRAQQLTQELDALRVTGHSADGAAEVTLTHTGALVDLYLGKTLEEASLERIRTAVLEASTNAQGQIGEHVAELSSRAFGADSQSAQELTRQFQEMFPRREDDGPEGPGGSMPGVLR